MVKHAVVLIVGVSRWGWSRQPLGDKAPKTTELASVGGGCILIFRLGDLLSFEERLASVGGGCSRVPTTFDGTSSAVSVALSEWRWANLASVGGG